MSVRSPPTMARLGTNAGWSDSPDAEGPSARPTDPSPAATATIRVRRSPTMTHATSATAATVVRTVAYTHGSISRAPTESTDEYAAIVTPVAIANGTADSAMPARDDGRSTRHGRWRARMPARRRPTPAHPSGGSVSPRTRTPTRTARSGAVPRAVG